MKQSVLSPRTRFGPRGGSCPACRSSWYYWRSATGTFVCKRCGRAWKRAAESKEGRKA